MFLIRVRLRKQQALPRLANYIYQIAAINRGNYNFLQVFFALTPIRNPQNSTFRIFFVQAHLPRPQLTENA